MDEIDTFDDRVLLIGLPWCKAFSRAETELIIEAIDIGATSLTVDNHNFRFTAGQQLTLAEVRQVLEMIELVRPFHRQHHPDVK